MLAKPMRKSAAEKKKEAKLAKFTTLVNASRAALPTLTTSPATAHLAVVIPCALRKSQQMGYSSENYHSDRFKARTMGASHLYWAATQHGLPANQRMWKAPYGVSQKAVWDAVPFLNKHGQCDGLCGLGAVVLAAPAPPAAPCAPLAQPQYQLPRSISPESASDSSEESGYFSSSSGASSPTSTSFGTAGLFDFLSDNDSFGEDFGSDDGLPPLENLELPALPVVAPLSPNSRKRKSPNSIQQQGKLEQTQKLLRPTPEYDVMPLRADTFSPELSNFTDSFSSPPVGQLRPLDLNDLSVYDGLSLPSALGFSPFELESSPSFEDPFFDLSQYE